MSFHDDDLSSFRSSHKPVILSAIKSVTTASATDGAYARFVKPTFDFLIVLLFAPIILTIVGLSALIVALDGHNPFYAQERVGQGGRVFRLFKLRSMVPNADALLEAHLATNPDARLEWELNQKLRDDPRITRFGRLIRKTSIDEMPQFLNVLLGDMSLVGPRPFTVDQRSQYTGVRYFDMRPGLSGLWQISTRHDSEFVARAQFDDLYARSLSFAGDIRIMLRTLVAIARGTGC
ncbi:sugar transferase [Yoonia sp. R2331]|uniref:sugar transferase n=1 Tax=Yoonia sp. R2331 TaxID=3237238 RepID=UPI0034E5B35D